MSLDTLPLGDLYSQTDRFNHYLTLYNARKHYRYEVCSYTNKKKVLSMLKLNNMDVRFFLINI